jgi:ATP synthase protein I
MAQDALAPASAPDDTSAQFSAMLRGSALPTLAVGVIAVAIGLLVDTRSAWSAGLGALLVVVFFSISLLVMRQTARREPTVVMAVVLMAYTGKLLALTAALFLLRNASWISTRALGIATIACTVVWLGFEVRAFSRLRILVAPAAAGS